jgi:DNA-directed RNA polymerase specialized sigma24 family protein
VNQKIVKAYAEKLRKERGHDVGIGEAETDIYDIIRKVAGVLAPRLTFGYHTRQDIEQEAFVLALEVIEDEGYDPTRPLANFLYIHLRRRLTNNIRKDYYRGEPPCTCCDTVNPPASPCRKWVEWNKRNKSKQNIMRPLDVASVNDERETGMATVSTVEEDAESNEILAKIDRDLPVELRSDYLRMREHIVIPKSRRQRVRDAVLRILSPSATSEGDDAD